MSCVATDPFAVLQRQPLCWTVHAELRLPSTHAGAPLPA